MTLSKTSLIVLVGGLSGLDAAYSVHGSDWCPHELSTSNKSVRRQNDGTSVKIDDNPGRLFYDNGDCFEAKHKNQLVGGLRSGNGIMYLEGHNGRTKIEGYWRDDKLEYVISQSKTFTTKVVTKKSGKEYREEMGGTKYLEKTGKKLSSTLYSGQMLKTSGAKDEPKYVRHGYGQLWVSGRDEMYSGMWLDDELFVLYQHDGEIRTEKRKIVAVEENVAKTVGYTREHAKTEMAAIKDQLIEQAKVDLNKLKEDVNKEIHEKLDTEATATYDIYKTERHVSIRARENLDQHLKANNEAFIKILREQHEKNLKDLQAHHEKSIEEKEASVIEAIEKKESAVKEAIEELKKKNSSAAVAVTTALLITMGTLLF